jgi:hypothetical protein
MLVVHGLAHKEWCNLKQVWEKSKDSYLLHFPAFATQREIEASLGSYALLSLPVPILHAAFVAFLLTCPAPIVSGSISAVLKKIFPLAYPKPATKVFHEAGGAGP